ncbi:alpha/beta family hydrolase [Pseudomonadota bacterium]|uniref:alpha/beta family hydrolase n=1 Tax=unclassified Shewanella TaxID=196818 RepID=UPI000C83E9F2|nr:MULTISPECIES: alpha/beta family hydrolase [unclassified Shewanella]MDO6774686.1 dienelactone hydrolase family protein [Shewanella sp. 3_MG-2023]PMG32079.1 dienelactone hydrolase [Shewanella sp. 10N.286.52.C2]
MTPLGPAVTNDSLEIESILQGDPSKTLVVLAHGAGANMHHEFMVDIANGLVAKGYQVLRFNFLYMQANMQDGKRRPPDRAPKLLMHFTRLLNSIEQTIEDNDLVVENIVLMGKSMGGRMAATLLTDDELIINDEQVEISASVNALIKGCICLGYPFVPLKGGEPRLEPLNNGLKPLMVVQGERDKFGGISEIPQWDINKQVKVSWITDGDHSFKPRKSSGTTLEANLKHCLTICDQFITDIVD